MKTLALLLLLCVPFMAQDMPKQDDKDIPHPAPTFEIDPKPEVPPPPNEVDPTTCVDAKRNPCIQRLLLGV